ncbi:hypothetical protein BaRGS_00017791 [Batillaria attramentaria]|uniref:Uncharacterized protein n=1 Tax=Batillaria attramentaria TaxID=370345 RepID=A0ABD0KUM6_9CAEN
MKRRVDNGATASDFHPLTGGLSMTEHNNVDARIECLFIPSANSTSDLYTRGHNCSWLIEVRHFLSFCAHHEPTHAVGTKQWIVPGMLSWISD